MRQPKNFYYSKNFTFHFENINWVCQKHQVFIAIFTTAYWVKVAQPAEPIFPTSSLLLWTLRANPAEPASNIYNVDHADAVYLQSGMVLLILSYTLISIERYKRHTLY